MNKNILGIAAALVMLPIATAVSAQSVTGTVNITGSVAPKCAVTQGGGGTFSSTVALGELAQADGRLATDLAARFAASPASLQASVVCTAAAPTIAVDATEITSATASATGYANRIDFIARVAVDTVTQTGVPFTNDSRNAAGTATPIGARIANNSNNIRITATDFGTAQASDLLVAANDYSGRISIVIAPGA